jgi:four helix bundle protein
LWAGESQFEFRIADFELWIPLIFDCRFPIFNLSVEHEKMDKEELKARSKQMALRVIRFTMSLPRGNGGDVLEKQAVRSATSVAANYRAACKARSKADFISKLGIVEEEIGETQLWLEMIVESGLVKETRIQNLLDEVKQLGAIFAASRITARRNRSSIQRT